MTTKQFIDLLGIETGPVSHKERLVSALGAFTGIFFIFVISRWMLGEGQGAALVVASMGASAVLLFAVSHGALSQPWPVFGGHLVSAVIGVTCAKLLGNIYFAAPLAVGISVGVMYYLRCIHPPGGATALSAVIGGQAVLDLGYGFVLAPVLLNVIVMLLVAIGFNAFFDWRRYPSALIRIKTYEKQEFDSDQPISTRPIAHEDFVYALSQIDSFIDVSENDLLRIYDLATRRQRNLLK